MNIYKKGFKWLNKSWHAVKTTNNANQIKRNYNNMNSIIIIYLL